MKFVQYVIQVIKKLVTR